MILQRYVRNFSDVQQPNSGTRKGAILFAPIWNLKRGICWRRTDRFKIQSGFWILKQSAPVKQMARFGFQMDANKIASILEPGSVRFCKRTVGLRTQSG